MFVNILRTLKKPIIFILLILVLKETYYTGTKIYILSRYNDFDKLIVKTVLDNGSNKSQVEINKNNEGIYEEINVNYISGYKYSSGELYSRVAIEVAITFQIYLLSKENEEKVNNIEWSFNTGLLDDANHTYGEISRDEFISSIERVTYEKKDIEKLSYELAEKWVKENYYRRQDLDLNKIDKGRYFYLSND